MAEQPTDTTEQDSEKSEKKRFERIAQQVQDEFKAAENHSRSRKEQWKTYLKLYINQRKNPKKVGDTLMFSTHQTIMASLYDDRLGAEWMWREEEDTERIEQLNALYEFDYDEMEKPTLDYGKYWDACAFGIAIEDWSTFDRKVLTPLPTLWDPLTTYIDPQAVTLNGDRLGRGAARYYGRPILRTKDEMEKHGGFINLDKLESDSGATDEVKRAQQARDEARGLQTDFSEDGPNKYYPLLQWFVCV